MSPTAAADARATDAARASTFATTQQLPPPRPPRSSARPRRATQVDAAELATLSRLVDELLQQPDAEARRAWLAQLPAPHRHLSDRLARLAEAATADGRVTTHGSGAPGFLDRGPCLGTPPEGAHHAGERVGSYRLKRRLGEGGMGEVWLAERDDGIFEREVALKLPRMTAADAGDLAARMALERRIGAKLEHPNIARLYDAGVTDGGQPYIVMERLVGGDVRAHAKARRLDARGCVALVRQACDAIGHAHRQLVVHRDIKPSNLWVDDAGHVKLLDFGIARELDPHAADRTLPDARTHTPRYAAPEQLTPGGMVSTSTDLYSLAVVLLELLTGQTAARSAAALADPALKLDPSLQAILARALAAEPAQRYPTADAFAADLDRWARHEAPAGVALPSRWRMGLFTRRHRWSIGAGLAFTLLLGSAIVLQLHQIERERAQARRTEQVRNFLVDMFEDAEPHVGQAKTPVTARQIVEQARDRAYREFDDETSLRAQLLASLGVVSRRLEQPEQARALLRDAVELLARDDPSSSALHHARAQWAVQWVLDGHTAQAREHASLALAGCAGRTDVLCMKARAYAHNVLSVDAGQRGDDLRTLAEAKAAAAEFERAFGSHHIETAVSIQQVATALSNLDRFAEADATLARAEGLVRDQTLRDADARAFRFQRAELDLHLGRAARARRGFDALADGPPPHVSRPRLAALRARAALADGDADAALRAVAPVNDADGWDAVMLTEVQARAALRAGDRETAARASQAMATALDALGLPPNDTWRMRAALVDALRELADGNVDEARRRAQALQDAQVTSATPVDASVQARTLDLLGATLQWTSPNEQARDLHRRAAQLWTTRHDAMHPNARRSAELADAAMRQVVGDREPAKGFDASNGLDATRRTAPRSTDSTRAAWLWARLE